MIQVETIHPLRKEFARRTEAEAFRHFQRQQAEERRRRDREDETDKDAGDLIDFALTAISVAQERALRIEIDRYDTATVDALCQNERQLTEVQARLDDLFAKAYVLPDGRRVFKTVDGKHVFDEHGAEVHPSIIDPDMIEDWRPRWELVRDTLNEREALIEERSDLMKYQDKLDAARDRLDRGDMTQAEFERLQRDLLEDMPEAVRRRIPELSKLDREAVQQSAGAQVELDITKDDVPATMASYAPAPGG